MEHSRNLRDVLWPLAGNETRRARLWAVLEIRATFFDFFFFFWGGAPSYEIMRCRTIWGFPKIWRALCGLLFIREYWGSPFS